MTNREVSEAITRVHEEKNADGILLVNEVVRLRGAIYDLKETHQAVRAASFKIAEILARELLD
jgi:hypothetical protein